MDRGTDRGDWLPGLCSATGQLISATSIFCIFCNISPSPLLPSLKMIKLAVKLFFFFFGCLGTP